MLSGYGDVWVHLTGSYTVMDRGDFSWKARVVEMYLKLRALTRCCSGGNFSRGC